MAEKSTKRNLLLISLDDVVAYWKYKTVFGQALQTPNLDRICAQSTAFHSAYCHVPVCSPSRASLMTMQAPHKTGVTESDKHYLEKVPVESLWPYTLKQNGFYCSSGGKVPVGYRALQSDHHQTLYSDKKKSFTLFPRHWVGKRPAAEGEIERVKLGGFREGVATVREADDAHHYDHQVADSAIKFLRQYDGDQPFYREVGMGAAHGPWITPLRFKEMYHERQFSKPSAWENGFDVNEYFDEFSMPNHATEKIVFWRRSVRNYFSSMTHFDHHLGRVWDALKNSPHADNTLVVIFADHGLHLGERNRFRKHTLWEQVANVPLIIHDPTRPVPHVVTDPVGLIDIGPTVLDYMGLPPVADSPGRSLRPQMDLLPNPNRAVPTFLRDNASIRKGRYRIIQYEDGSTQFFDLAQDWWQTRDLGKQHPEFAQMHQALTECCKEWFLDLDAQTQAA